MPATKPSAGFAAWRVRRSRRACSRTSGPSAGLFQLESGRYKHPVLVSSADGVGTKLKVAFLADRHDTVGVDLVNHCVNDILVQGAEPLFFLDYLATGRLSPAVAESIVGGMATACRDNNCALLGGETAEMPGLYADGEYDLAGFIVGVVDRERLINGRAIAVGDVLVGVPSSGLHTNGYSLARRIAFEGLGLRVDSHVEALGTTVGQAFLEPHRSYLSLVQPLLDGGRIKGMAHITGGGITDNLPRILPHGTAAVVRSLVVGGSTALSLVAGQRGRPVRRHDAHVQHGHRLDHRDHAGSVRGADRGARRARRT